jgi:hypothetical protein
MGLPLTLRFFYQQYLSEGSWQRTKAQIQEVKKLTL